MAGELPGERSGGELGASRGASAAELPPGPGGRWFPLLLCGGLAALALAAAAATLPSLAWGTS